MSRVSYSTSLLGSCSNLTTLTVMEIIFQLPTFFFPAATPLHMQQLQPFSLKKQVKFFKKKKELVTQNHTGRLIGGVFSYMVLLLT